MPPESSSHTTNPPKQVIRISPLAYLGCAFLLFAVSFPIFGWPAAFGWLVIAPIVAAAWVARVRTTVTSDGLEVRRLFGGRSLAWSEITGFRFPRSGWARATLADGGEVTLPVVTFDRLPEIAEASGGRITDPYAAAAAAEEAAHHTATESDGEHPADDRPATDGE
ncbi:MULTISPECIES: PH domain-containing protein [unclassified Rhodococcus (in: high G+C Gram-positive bacteria)]|uniref:PH domain-containing protein n=1 Tax=unclassified Rhodococcus (in: high G+C Gram-positive bacteria) TaxID=192944 RepID=UPI00163ADA6F|nr:MULTISPECIES: PH domain-containing protein [unclassified Rhodococcus (in: high G+C Gram-positive bacteria)]MBC2643679.1 PH domain-containing protein [Rhodococcus sp. 3A]MBC2891580.1 PH domain-containing protein [Rhodococcus sp. 4CII]